MFFLHQRVTRPDKPVLERANDAGLFIASDAHPALAAPWWRSSYQHQLQRLSLCSIHPPMTGVANVPSFATMWCVTLSLLVQATRARSLSQHNWAKRIGRHAAQGCWWGRGCPWASDYSRCCCRRRTLWGRR